VSGAKGKKPSTFKCFSTSNCHLFPLLQERAAAAGDFSAPAPIRRFPLLSGVLVGAGEGGGAQSAGGLYSSLFLA